MPWNLPCREQVQRGFLELSNLFYLELTLIGLFAGVIGGMLGIGGSLVMIPALTLVSGPNQHLYQAAAMIVNVFVALPAVREHKREGAVNHHVVRRLVPVAVVAVIVGVLLSELPALSGDGEPRLRGAFGLFLLTIAAIDLYRLIRRRLPGGNRTAVVDERFDPQFIERHATWWRVLGVAVPTGVIAGLLGVGGGAIAVPLLRRFMRLPMRMAIATSLALIVLTASVGAVVKNYAWLTEHVGRFDPLVLALLLIPTAIIGSLVGSRLMHRLPIRIIKAAFLLLLIVVAMRMTFGAWRDI